MNVSKNTGKFFFFFMQLHEVQFVLFSKVKQIFLEVWKVLL